jgi:hypothetical protein
MIIDRSEMDKLQSEKMAVKTEQDAIWFALEHIKEDPWRTEAEENVRAIVHALRQELTTTQAELSNLNQGGDSVSTPLIPGARYQLKDGREAFNPSLIYIPADLTGWTLVLGPLRFPFRFRDRGWVAFGEYGAFHEMGLRAEELQLLLDTGTARLEGPICDGSGVAGVSEEGEEDSEAINGAVWKLKEAL